MVAELMSDRVCVYNEIRKETYLKSNWDTDILDDYPDYDTLDLKIFEKERKDIIRLFAHFIKELEDKLDYKIEEINAIVSDEASWRLPSIFLKEYIKLRGGSRLVLCATMTDDRKQWRNRRIFKMRRLMKDIIRIWICAFLMKYF